MSDSIFSIDVEDWFNLSGTGAEPPPSEWDGLESRLERNFHGLLELLAEGNATATCFVVGYFAKRFPQLVREAVAAGHEIASHGYFHRLIYQMSAVEFCKDARAARELLEDLSGRPVRGFRAPAFSVTERTPWFFDKLVEAGYRYDSSVFPAPHQTGGLATGAFAPYTAKTHVGAIEEFPITAVRVFGKPMCFFGGGYLRLFPYSVIRAMGRRALGEGRPVIFYVHPREIDPAQPRMALEPPPPLHLLCQSRNHAAENQTHLARLSGHLFRPLHVTKDSAVNDRTSEFFDRYAVDFDSIYGNDNKALERIANRLFRHAMLVRYQKTIAGCQPAAGRSVIDIGCGPGHYSITLARQGADKILGSRFRPRHAQDRARARRIRGRGRALQLRARRFPHLSAARAVRLCDRDGLHGLRAAIRARLSSGCSTSCACARFSASPRPAARSPGSGNGATATAATFFSIARSRSARCWRRPARLSRSSRSGAISS